MPGTIFPIQKKESIRAKLRRAAFNLFPAYRRSGGRLCYLSDDWREVHVRLSLNWKTRNYLGTVFGGSIYGAVDPVYMMQLINILGKEYVVWDKSALIRFIKPVRRTDYARFVITEEMLETIRHEVRLHQKCIMDFPLSFQDESGTVYDEFVKTL